MTAPGGGGGGQEPRQMPEPEPALAERPERRLQQPLQRDTREIARGLK